jgi:mRNA-degrading endonuclease RelE of RelBE toxin-antitoxin system
MNYEVVLSHRFKRDFKKLKRKYKSIKTDVTKAIDLVEDNPEVGVSLGNGLHKLRISISSKTSGNPAEEE